MSWFIASLFITLHNRSNVYVISDNAVTLYCDIADFVKAFFGKSKGA